MERPPVDWNGKKIEDGFYETREGGLVYIKRQRGDFMLFTLGVDKPRPLVQWDGQYVPYLRVDPVRYLERKEGELCRIARFIQGNID